MRLSELSAQAEDVREDKAGRRCRSAGERRWLRAEGTRPAPAPPPPARSHRRSVTTGRLTRPLSSTCLFKLSTQPINTFNYPYRETNQSPSALGRPLRFLTRKTKQSGGGRSGVALGGGGIPERLGIITGGREGDLSLGLFRSASPRTPGPEERAALALRRAPRAHPGPLGPRAPRTRGSGPTSGTAPSAPALCVAGRSLLGTPCRSRASQLCHSRGVPR